MPALPNNRLYTQLHSPVQEELHVQFSHQTLPFPNLNLSSKLFLIQTGNWPAVPELPAHFVWNASKTLYIENIGLYAVKYVTGGMSRFLAHMMASSNFTFTVTSKKYKGIMWKGRTQRRTEESRGDIRREFLLKDFQDNVWYTKSRLEYDDVYDF